MNCDFNVEEIRFPTPWGHIAGKAWGDKKHMLVLTIHGFGENAATFDHLIPLLPRCFYYLCIDLPSHGRSSIFPLGMSLDFFAFLRALHRVLYVHMRCTKCILLSHSAGGHFCLYLASMYPEMVEKVVLLDMIPFFLIVNNDEILDNLRNNLIMSISFDKQTFTKNQFPSHDKLVQVFRRKHFTPISEKSATTLLSRETEINKDQSDTFITTVSDNRRELLIFPIITMDFHLTVIENIKLPVLYIITSESKDILTRKLPISSASISHLKKYLGALFKIEYVEGNHSVHLEHPERVAHLITTFLSSDRCCL